MKRQLGVCWYPEHWPEDIWAEDAARMAEAGITVVRIGEFAWSRMEPVPGVLDLGWLDRAFDVLGAAGLGVVLGTPTATPPAWMVTRHPDMLPVDAAGRTRGFGSRRHYSFSHTGYRAECVRIAGILAARYGRHPHLTGWQTDNEYGCHDTTRSYGAVDAEAFREWLAQRYQSPQALNRAWGNVFWSMEIADFAEVGLPALTVTEANPAAAMDFRRFASDALRAFNAAQVAAIRAHSDAPIAHNYMGGVTSFDHFAVGADLDIAAWDSYPLGFLSERIHVEAADKARYLRQGDPDYQAFHHDLYRSVGRGRWWIMEQQPGPVNWAPWNPIPAPGMLRLWAWEAFAHGAEVVSWFRWRQAPFAQEAMHAGLLRPDSAAAPGLAEVAEVARELTGMPDAGTARATVAVVFDYASAWAWEVQPQGRDFAYLDLVLAYYRAFRRLGLDIDVVPPDVTDLSPWQVVAVPGLATVPAGLLAALGAFEGAALVGPRTGAKTAAFATPVPLPPSLPGLDAVVARVESLPPGASVALEGGGSFVHWHEELDGSAEIAIRCVDGTPAVVRAGGLTYVAGWPDDAALDRIVGAACEGLETFTLPTGLRTRTTQTHRFWINYGLVPASNGRAEIPACGVTWEPLR